MVWIGGEPSNHPVPTPGFGIPLKETWRQPEGTSRLRAGCRKLFQVLCVTKLGITHLSDSWRRNGLEIRVPAAAIPWEAQQG